MSQVPQGSNLLQGTKVIENGLKEAHRLSELWVTWASCSSSTPAYLGKLRSPGKLATVKLKLRSPALQSPVPLRGPGVTLHS